MLRALMFAAERHGASVADAQQATQRRIMPRKMMRDYCQDMLRVMKIDYRSVAPAHGVLVLPCAFTPRVRAQIRYYFRR